MGCVCCSLSTFVSILLHALERITLCTVCAMLVCCILFTVISVLIMGVGIGFHYCEVQNSVEAMANAAKAASSMASESRRAMASRDNKMLRSVNQAVKRGFAHRLGRRDRSDQRMPSNNNTINDAILGALALNDSAAGTARRSKRDLTLLPLNDTANFANDSLTYEYYDDMNRTSVNGTLGAEMSNAPASNVSMHDAILLRQNCTLLNFFTRFLQF